MAIDWRPKIFDIGAAFYGFFTTQNVWARANRRLVDHFPGDVTRVLDVGCGAGATILAEARACPSAEIVGVDVSREMVRLSERALRSCEPSVARRVRVLLADAAHLPFDASTFDVVTGHSFLYLVRQRATVLAEIVRVLRPGGRAVFMEPHRAGLSPRDVLAVGLDPRFLVSIAMWRTVSRYSGRFTREELSAALLDAGLTPIASEIVLGGAGIIISAEKRIAAA